MPKRFLAESIRVGEAERPAHRKEYFDELVTEYYQERGWDPEEGTISPQRMAELGLASRKGDEHEHRTGR
jgi:aldehyde:ferredoxin oxidoreductase